mmetsp:Transcript_54186/g.162232  ORF Transcript_54186/g.162232 Transcript_54186/m.162232 type:complete len:480 (-) Transcript_54186:165-1604(-)
MTPPKERTVRPRPTTTKSPLRPRVRSAEGQKGRPRGTTHPTEMALVAFGTTIVPSRQRTSPRGPSLRRRRRGTSTWPWCRPRARLARAPLEEEGAAAVAGYRGDTAPAPRRRRCRIPPRRRGGLPRPENLRRTGRTSGGSNTNIRVRVRNRGSIRVNTKARRFKVNTKANIKAGPREEVTRAESTARDHRAMDLLRVPRAARPSDPMGMARAAGGTKGRAGTMVEGLREVTVALKVREATAAPLPVTTATATATAGGMTRLRPRPPAITATAVAARRGAAGTDRGRARVEGGRRPGGPTRASRATTTHIEALRSREARRATELLHRTTMAVQEGPREEEEGGAGPLPPVTAALRVATVLVPAGLTRDMAGRGEVPTGATARPRVPLRWDRPGVLSRPARTCRARASRRDRGTPPPRRALAPLPPWSLLPIIFPPSPSPSHTARSAPSAANPARSMGSWDSGTSVSIRTAGGAARASRCT